MQSKRLMRMAAASFYGTLLAVGRPTAEALDSSARGLLAMGLMASVFFIAAVLGIFVALGPGPWWWRLVRGLMSWLTMLVLYFIGCGNSEMWLQGDLFTPASVCTFLFAALVLSLVRWRKGWRIVDALAPAETASPRQFSLAQLLLATLVLAGCCGILQIALRGTRFPDWLSWLMMKAILLHGESVVVTILFAVLALPWMLAAFAGWRAVIWAAGATLVTAAAILAYMLCFIVPRAGPMAGQVIAITVVVSLIPPLPAYILVRAFRWLGFRMQWSGAGGPR